MDKVKDYGEPWELTLRTINGISEPVMETVTGDYVASGLSLDAMERIVPCVNAMQGHDLATAVVVDRAKWEGLIHAATAVRDVMTPDICQCHDDPCVYCDLRAALRDVEATK